MNKNDLVEALSKKTSDLNKTELKKIVDTFLDTICEALSNGDHVEIRGFGVFNTKERNCRKARNPKTGQEILIPNKIVASFKASKNIFN